jgi:hypothetical protein
MSDLLRTDRSTYVSRLIKSFSALTPVIHPSAMVIATTKTPALLRRIPQMHHLSDVAYLPSLRIRAKWPTHLLTLQPISTVLIRPLARKPDITEKLELLTGDAILWSRSQGILLQRAR